MPAQLPLAAKMTGVLRASLRVLDRADLDAALAVCDRDPIANAFVASRLVAHGITRSGGGELWGYHDGGELVSLCWSGANLVPVNATRDALDAFAARARRQGRLCSSIVGPSDHAMYLWSRLRPVWGPAREVRDDQPLLAIASVPLVPADPWVRPATTAELDLLIPACVAMFTEEVGYSPVLADGGSLYRAQINALVTSGRSLVRTQQTPAGDQVVFKAELGSVTPAVVQVQGVWVNPSFRGRGLAVPGMAAVVDYIRRNVAPVTSLYVNAYNTRALHVYERVGFARVGTFATVLF